MWAAGAVILPGFTRSTHQISRGPRFRSPNWVARWETHCQAKIALKSTQFVASQQPP